MGRTLADLDVRDSDNSPVDPAEDEADKRPFIAVYTDEQTAEGVTLTIETAISARMVVIDPETGQPSLNEYGQSFLAPGIPPTDAGIEATIDIIERQINTALNDESNAWGRLLKQLASGLTKVQSTRGVMKTDLGERFAGRTIAYLGAPLADPEFGQEIKAGSFWHRFLAAVAGEPNLAQMEAPLRALLTDGESVEGWRLVLRAMGHGLDAGGSLGAMPAMGLDIAPPIANPVIDAGPKP